MGRTAVAHAWCQDASRRPLLMLCLHYCRRWLARMTSTHCSGGASTLHSRMPANQVMSELGGGVRCQASREGINMWSEREGSRACSRDMARTCNRWHDPITPACV